MITAWKFFYKILSLIDPEISHNLTLKIIESGFLPKIKTKPIPLKVMNIQFQNPIHYTWHPFAQDIFFLVD